MKSDYGFLARLVVYVLIVFGTGILSERFLDNWYLGAVILMLSSVAFMFFIRLLRFRDLYRIIRFGEAGGEF